MHVATRVFFLGVIHELVYIALERSIAARRVGVEPAARLDGEVCGLLHRLDGAITGRLDDDGPLTTHPGDNRGPVFIIMALAGLPFLAPAPRPASQRLLPAVGGLALVPRRVIEGIRFHCALQLTTGCIGESRVAEPPTPAIAGANMEP